MKLPTLPKRRPKLNSPKPPKTVSSYHIAKGAVSDLQRGWKGYFWILVIIGLPYSLIALSQSLSQNAALNAYGYVALLIMNAAVLWAALHQERTGEVPRPSHAYYEGSAAMVRLLVISVLLVLMLIPFIVGMVLYIIGATSLVDAGTPAELLLVVSMAVLISLPSFIFMTRFGLAMVVAADTGLRPVAALRHARRLTLGRFWRMVARYGALVLFMVIVTLPMVGLYVGIIQLHHTSLATLLFGLLLTFITLPLFNLYLLRFYRSLQPANEK